MQATVKEFSDETRTGSVILDDGAVIPLAPQVFSASGLRSLRPGQRVRLEVTGDGDGRVVSLVTLATF